MREGEKTLAARIKEACTDLGNISRHIFFYTFPPMLTGFVDAQTASNETVHKWLREEQFVLHRFHTAMINVWEGVDS